MGFRNTDSVKDMIKRILEDPNVIIDKTEYPIPTDIQEQTTESLRKGIVEASSFLKEAADLYKSTGVDTSCCSVSSYIDWAKRELVNRGERIK
jgi:hypothetical protein